MPGRLGFARPGPLLVGGALESDHRHHVSPFSDHPIIYLMARQLLVRRWGLAGKLIDEREG